jgi:hypoxanthine phosphoribosyltransferase
MNKIKIHDKYFKPFIGKEEIEKAVQRMADRINEDYKGKIPLFLVILNGSFMVAADLLKKITLECEVSFVKLASYSGTKSTETIRELIGFDENVKGREIIIIEDIIDSGLTMERVLSQLKNMGAKDVKISTLLFKPEAFKKTYAIDYIGIEIPNDFIIGYGLDYDGRARNLPDIYKITD